VLELRELLVGNYNSCNDILIVLSIAICMEMQILYNSVKRQFSQRQAIVTNRVARSTSTQGGF